MVKNFYQGKKWGRPSQFEGDMKGARSLRVNVYNNNILNQKNCGEYKIQEYQEHQNCTEGIE